MSRMPPCTPNVTTCDTSPTVTMQQKGTHATQHRPVQTCAGHPQHKQDTSKHTQLHTEIQTSLLSSTATYMLSVTHNSPNGHAAISASRKCHDANKLGDTQLLTLLQANTICLCSVQEQFTKLHVTTTTEKCHCSAPWERRQTVRAICLTQNKPPGQLTQNKPSPAYILQCAMLFKLINSINAMTVRKSKLRKHV